MAGTESESGFTFVDRRRRGGEAAADVPRTPPAAPPQSPPPPSPSSLITEPGSRPAGPPRADLSALCVMLYSDAMVNLGQVPDPAGGRPRVDLEQARFAIDLLAMLQDKTHGNRTPEESDVLEEMLAALRMAFVQMSRRG